MDFFVFWPLSTNVEYFVWLTGIVYPSSRARKKTLYNKRLALIVNSNYVFIFRVNGKQYFECPQNYGSFVKPQYVTCGDFPEVEYDMDEEIWTALIYMCIFEFIITVTFPDSDPIIPYLHILFCYTFKLLMFLVSCVF